MPDAVRLPDEYGSNRIGTHGGSTASCDPHSDQAVIATQSILGYPTEQLGQCYTQQQPLLLQFYAGRA
jgi:hypothetical protein